MALDRFKKAIRKLAESPEEKYYGLYPYTVVDVENVGGSTLLDLKAEVQNLPNLSKIQWVFPIANISFGSATPTTKVLVGFFEGDPTKPYAMPIFLAGMIGDVIMNTGGYDHNVLRVGETVPTYRVDAQGPIFLTSNDTRALQAADITLSADGNVRLNPGSEGDASKAVIVQNGTRNVARQGEPVTLNLELSVIAPFGGGPCTVTWTSKSAEVTSGTSKLKVP